MGDISKLALRLPWKYLEQSKGVDHYTSSCHIPVKVNDVDGNIFVESTKLCLSVTIQAHKESLLNAIENGWQCWVSTISSETPPVAQDTVNDNPVIGQTGSENVGAMESNSLDAGKEGLIGLLTEEKTNEEQCVHTPEEPSVIQRHKDNGSEDNADFDTHMDLQEDEDEEVKQRIKRGTKRKALGRKKMVRKTKMIHITAKTGPRQPRKKIKKGEESGNMSEGSRKEANNLQESGKKKKPLVACVFCFKTFVSRVNLQRHLQKFHKLTWDIYTEGEKYGGASILAIRQKISEIQQEYNLGKVEGEVKDVQAKEEGTEVYDLMSCKICHLPLSSDRRSQTGHFRKNHNLSIEEYDNLDKLETKKERETFLNDKLKDRKKKRSKSQICSACDKTFSSLASYAVHVKAVHADDEEVLLEMEKRRSASNTSGVIMTCPVCQEVRHGKAIFRHFRDLHPKHEDFDKIMNELQDYYKQAYLKSEREKYRDKLLNKSAKCKFCQEEFEHRWARSRHQRKCPQNPQPNKFLHCSVCTRSFSNQTQLIEHKKQHLGGQEYCCEYCGSSYKNKSGLYVHLRRAHDIKMKAPNFRHTCTICDKKFFDKNRFDEHLKRHTDVRDKICDHCGKAFKTDTDVQKHIKVVHLNRYRFYCNRCGHGMAKLSYLKTHKCGRIRRVQAENAVDLLMNIKKETRFAPPRTETGKLGEMSASGGHYETGCQSNLGDVSGVASSGITTSVSTTLEESRTTLDIKDGDYTDINQSVLPMHSTVSQGLDVMDYSAHATGPVPPPHPQQQQAMMITPQLPPVPAHTHPAQHPHEHTPAPYVYMPAQPMSACYPGLQYMGADGTQGQNSTQ